jgi:spermidine synthase
MKPATLLLPLFVASGAAALVYEVVWFQLLALQVGGATRAIALVLATFMAGLGAGALVIPRLIRNSSDPLRACAALEVFTALCGLALPGAIAATGILSGALQWLAVSLLLLPPTLAMGGTLPIAARALGSGRQATRHVAGLYAANTFGGVLGCLLAGFHLLRLHDVWVATFVAVALNLAAALWAATLWRRGISSHTAANPSAIPAAGPERTASRLDQGVLVAACLSGATALAAEVVWTRLLTLLLGGTTYTFSLILAGFLTGIGIGAAVASQLRPPRPWLAWCQVALVPAIAWGAWSLGVGLPAWPINPRLAASPWGQFQVDFVRCLVAVLPAAILWGASLPLAIASACRDGRSPSRATAAVLAANTLGAVLGSLAAALWLLPGAGSRSTQAFLVATAAVAAVVAMPPRPRGMSGLAGWPRIVPAITAILLALWLVPRVPELAPALVAWGRLAAVFREQPVEFLTVREGADSTLAVSRSADGSLNYHNAGKVQASGEPQDMRLQRMLGHMATLVPEHPRTVLVIGCGAGVTAGSVSVDPAVVAETICEIEAEVPRTAGEYFGPINQDVIRNPKVTVTIDDARHYLRTTTDRFDAITSDPFDPWVRGAANLYTREFFQSARDHLTPGGVITVFVQLYEAGTPAVKSEIATFLEVFPDGLVFGNTAGGEGYDLVLLGCNGPTVIDLDRIDERLRGPGTDALRESLADIGCSNAADLFASFAATGPQLRGWLADAEINRDANLRLQYLAGLGVNAYEQKAIYRKILAAGDWPEGVFAGSVVRMNRLKKLGRKARY